MMICYNKKEIEFCVLKKMSINLDIFFEKN